MWQAVAAVFATIVLVLKKIFDTSEQNQKKKEDAADKTSENIFMGWLIVLVLLVPGCNNVNLGDVPAVFDSCDYQPLTAGQSFIVPKDGVYFSLPAAKKWIRAKIFEYELNKNGFGVDEKEK